MLSVIIGIIISVIKGVRQGSSVIFILFNINIDDLLRKRKQLVNTGFNIIRDRYLNFLFFAGDLRVIQNK